MRADAARAALALLAVLVAADGAAQGHPARPPEPPTLDWAVSSDIVRDLPAANALAILETMQPELIADRFNSGGLAAGGASFIVAPLGSRSQTRYRIGDFDVGGPTTGGTLLFPELAFWQRVETTTGLMPAATQAPSLIIGLDAVRPPSRWGAVVEGFLSGASLASSGTSSGPPPISRLQDWTRGTILVGGPLGRRHALSAGAAWSRSGTLVRQRADVVRERARSLFAHYVFAPSAGRELRTVGWLQSVHAPAPFATTTEHTTTDDAAIHIQSTFESSREDRTTWRAFGGYTQRRRNEDPSSPERMADRLVDGPMPALLPTGNGVERRWAFGGRLTPRWWHGRQQTRLGLDIAGTAMRLEPSSTLIGELVDGMPARVWSYSSGGLGSQRGTTSISTFLEHRVSITPATTLDAALAYETVTGSARGSADGIGWHTLLPRVAVRWDLGTPAALTLVSGYRRSANQLTLDLLSYGDPAAPAGRVSRWDAGTTIAAPGPLVALVGPGTAGNPGFSAIDRALQRPHADEFVIALESRPSMPSRLRVAGIARREARLVSVVNVGVPMDAYTMFLIPDANADLVGAADDQLLPVYERRPESFGRDRYLLTNPDEPPATMGAVVITAEVATARLFLSVGATASRAVGQGASRGFRGIENDQDALGERLVTANAATNARGRLFSDRAYTIKWTTVYRFPWDVRVGAIARYQDGQPFSRLVIVPGLAQGTDIVQAFPNGRSRFAFTGTLDVRLQKGFAAGSGRLEAIVDVYNLLDMRKEVEEYVVTGDRFRSPTAVQPPLAVHVGLRLTFGR